jgi:hypothetical protein
MGIGMEEDVAGAFGKYGKNQTTIYFTATLLWAITVFG